MTPKRAYPENPLVGVGAVVFRGEDILMIKRTVPPRQHEWSFPGGLQNLGETVFETAIRETLEETGVRVGIEGLAGIVDVVDRDAEGRVRYHYTIIDVWGTWEAGEPTPGDDAAEAQFIAPGKIKTLGLWDEALRMIAKARAQRFQNPKQENFRF